MSFDARILTGVGVLATVTEVGNFARAAEVLGLTPSGVSRAVARLEARIGVRLFDRTPRSVTLTEEGRRFHAQVIPLLAGIEEAAIRPAAAAWNPAIGEFILPYEAVRRSRDPRQAILDFAESTFTAGATLQRWDPALLLPYDSR